MEVVNRRPFRTTADWLSAQLENVVLDCKRLQESSDKNDLEAAQGQGKSPVDFTLYFPSSSQTVDPKKKPFYFTTTLARKTFSVAKTALLWRSWTEKQHLAYHFGLHMTSRSYYGGQITEKSLIRRIIIVRRMIYFFRIDF